MAGTLVPEDESLGNYRQNRRVQSARLLFYGGRSLGPALTDPSERTLIIYGASTGTMPTGLRVLYRAGDLVLFGIAGVGISEDAE